MAEVACNPVFKSDLKRNLVEYHPSVWGDYFLQYASESMEFDKKIVAKIETLKKEVRNLLVTDKLLAKIIFIDSICRLGVSYHFNDEIEDILQDIYKSYVENEEITLDYDLCSLAILFRLLRQYGFYVSPNVFNKFKDEQGNFSERLIKDVEGMLSLYEASHMMIHGEDILEEALAFTSNHLKSVASQLSSSLAAQVNHSLRQPLHKNLPRLEARSYISLYEQNPSHNSILLTSAKLDFNMLQSLHQKEFGNFCKWWKELDIPTKLPYARDRSAELCFWILNTYFEPQYSQARKIMTKVIALLSLIDDTYDAYGTIDELEIFTKAIERWDISILDDLPDYMKLIYRIFWNIYEEIEQEMSKEGRLYTLTYYIQEFKKAIQAFMTEARWMNENYIPTTEEYMRVSMLSASYPLLIFVSYIGIGDNATKNIFDWVLNEPKIVTAASHLCRLSDEIVSSEFEHKREHVCSLLDCYTKQYGISLETAIQECQKRIAITWKDMNEECLRPTKVPMPFLTCCLNLSRFIDVIYKDKDNYTHSKGVMKTYIKVVVVDPIPI